MSRHIDPLQEIGQLPTLGQRRRELRPVITTGTEIMDQLFTET
jgi:hypothetical protein